MIVSRNLIWIFINLITLITDCIFFMKFLDISSKRKSTKISYRVNFCILIITLMILNFRNNSYIYILVSYIFYKFNYESNFIKSIITPVIFWSIYIDIIKPISSKLAISINYTSRKILKGDIFAIEMILLSYSILIVFILIYKYIIFKNNIFINLNVITIILVNIVSFLFIFRISAKYIDGASLDNVVIVSIGFFTVIFNLYLLKVINELVEKNNLKLENKLMKEKINLEKKYIDSINESHEKIRILKHDMKNHLICIKSICNDNQLLEKYIDEINLNISIEDNIYNTGNAVLDSILKEKINICKMHDINFIVELNFSRNEFMELLDVCSIFSNSIDNAIEACIKLDKDNKRYIKLRGNYIKDMFVFKIENSKSNKVTIKNDRILTDKKNSKKHGFGIQSIKKSVKKYNGEVSIDYTLDKFILNIIIPLDTYNLCSKNNSL